MFAYRNMIYVYKWIYHMHRMHACIWKKISVYIYIHIHAYMYIHVGICVHVPIEHGVNRNLGLFHKIDAQRIITACNPMCNGDALYM